MPIEPSTTIDRPPSWIGRRSSPRIRSAAADASSSATTLTSRTANSSPLWRPDDVALADRAGEALRDPAQDLVAGRVPEGVVDPLEVVEVHEQQGDAPGLAALPREGALEVIAQQHAVGEAGQRVVERVVDEPRLQPLAVRRVDEQALRDPLAAPGVVGHRERLVPDPDLRAVPGQHPVLRPERLAGPPVRVVGRDRRGPVVRMDPAGPELGVVDELVGPVAEDPGDLRAHVGEAAAVRHVGIGHVDVDGGRDVLDEDLEARRRLVRLARRPLEARRPPSQARGAGSPRSRGRAPSAATATTTSTRGRAGHGGAEDRGEAEDREHDGAAEQPDDVNAVGHAELLRGPIHAATLRPPSDSTTTEWDQYPADLGNDSRLADALGIRARPPASRHPARAPVDQRGLVERAQRGDHDAFAVLAGASIARLDAAARLIVRDHDLARDAVQETLVRCWRDLPTLRDVVRLRRLAPSDSSFIACLDLVRRRKRRPGDRGRAHAPPRARRLADFSGQLIDRDLLDRALGRPRALTWRAIVVLHYFLEIPAARGGARSLGIPLGRPSRGSTARSGSCGRPRPETSSPAGEPVPAGRFA